MITSPSTDRQTARRGSAATCAVFDVDGTVCATNSLTALVWLRAQQHHPWRHRLWLASLSWRMPVAWLADCVSRDLADRLVFAQFAGLSLERAEAEAAACCHELLLPSCFPDALREMELHRRAGRRIVLLSGGVSLALAPLARALNADLLAQRLTAHGDRLTGRYRTYAELDDANAAFAERQGQRKRSALLRYAEHHNVDLSASFAYGDSINDAEMLMTVGNPVVINPDWRLSRIAVRRQWEIRRWRGQ